jgi:hypothetical protein
MASSLVGRIVLHAAPDRAICMSWFATFDVTPPSPGWLFVPVRGSQ